ncbi:M14 family metallopeptidase [Saccharomonospora xinjiangensis]|uniref:Zinc carboxypeptidase n=1 Tax=Saccharomonospora xinjiangensis XJ-54 TaxID=882086 RepID=I0V8Y0_9PSEU|nr:M14 family metallopeptidase [Saccharomonospora xinjiangensis]EID56583.1 putative carboxypeptidase [Saccharomonospora xinjiangensis XJ-54]
MKILRRGSIAAAGLLLLAASVAPAGAAQDDNDRMLYEARGTDSAQRTAIARSGADIWGTSDGVTTFSASAALAKSLQAKGIDVERVGDVEDLLAARNPDMATSADEFPAGDEGYHTYGELTEVLQRADSEHGDIASLSSAGSSYQGRALHLMKISDNVAQDEDEPEVLFTCNQHAREHLTTEMCLRIVERFTDEYGTDPTVTELVNTREIYVIPSVNPDGSEYDIEGGRYKGWRKNRQGYYGTDLNRNWGYKWGCCGGSSGSPYSDTYRGTSAFSAPETRAVASFVESRVVGGSQQIKAHIDFHTYSELVLWPYGYTYSDTTDTMSREEARRFQEVGRKLAASNGYTPQQSSDLYITDGSVNDWMWAEHGILSLTFEMYPASGGGIGGFYPPDERIEPETRRNDEAVDILLTEAGAQP